MPTKRKKTVLLIEDEADIQDIYKTKFARRGFSVIVADSGIEGIKLAAKRKPDIVLLDVVLPLKEGFAVLEELKKNPATKSIPVVMLSNLDQPYEIEMAKNLGAAAYLTKAHVTPAEVVEKVKEMLE